MTEMRREMADTVMVEIPVTPEAAEALGDPERRERVGKLVSSMLRPRSMGDDPLAAIFASIKSAARADGLTDEEIEAELAAYNADVVFDASSVIGAALKQDSIPERALLLV